MELSECVDMPPDGPGSGDYGGAVLLPPPEIDPVVGRRVGVRARRRRPPKRCGSFGVWLVDDCPYQPASGSSAAPARLAGAAERQRVVGLGVVSWSFSNVPVAESAGAAGGASRLGLVVLPFRLGVLSATRAWMRACLTTPWRFCVPIGRQIRFVLIFSLNAVSYI